MTDHLTDHRGNLIVRTGDEVENNDARFFVGAINESQQLCTLDKSRLWTLKNEAIPMAACIRQGNYSASIVTLRNLSNVRGHLPLAVARLVRRCSERQARGVTR